MSHDQKRDTREQLLRAGMTVLTESAHAHLRRVLTASAVADRAGVHRQTFYRHWETQADYVEEFVRYVTDPRNSISSARLAAIEGELDRDSDDPAAEVRRMTERTFAQYAADPVHTARMILWAVHRNDEFVLECLRGLYRANDEVTAAGYEAIGRAWGIEARPPFTMDTIALLFNALRDGLFLHLLIDDERVPDTFLPDVTVALSSIVTRRIGDPSDDEDIDEAFRARVSGDVASDPV